jgi:hypothetical protein
MPPLIAPDIQFSRFIGADPAAGIVGGRKADNSVAMVLGYSEPADSALVFKPLIIAPAAVDATAYLVNAQNATSTGNAQAVILAQTATVQAALLASNLSGGAAYVGALTSHALIFLTGAVARMRLTAVGDLVLGAVDIGGTAMLRVQGSAAFGNTNFVVGSDPWPAQPALVRFGAQVAALGALHLLSSGGAALNLRASSGGIRYIFGMDNSAEAGVAGGSYFYMYAFDNTGAYVDRPLFYDRSTFAWSLSRVVNVTTQCTVGAISGALGSLMVAPDANGAAAYVAGTVNVAAAHAAAFRVYNAASGSVALIVDTTVGTGTFGVYSAWDFAVSTSINKNLALFSVDCSGERVYVGRGYSYFIPLDVHGPVYALSAIALNGTTVVFDSGLTRTFYHQTSRPWIQVSGGVSGDRNIHLAATHEFYDVSGAAFSLSVDAQVSVPAGYCGLTINVPGVGVRRIKVLAANTGPAGSSTRLLVIDN